MRPLLLLAAASSLALAAGCQRQAPAPAADDEYSYAVGVELGAQVAPRKAELELAAVHRGLDDALAPQGARLSVEQARALIREYDEKHGAQRAGAARSLAEQNLAAGKVFVAAQAAKAGMKTLPGGIVFEVLTVGEGPTPAETDQVMVHYVGRLADGTVFDDSHSQPVPVSVPLTATLPGWREVLPLMSVGSKYRVWLPGPLAFGEQGLGTRVGPQAAVVYELELLGIVR